MASAGRGSGGMLQGKFEKIGAIRCILAHFHADYFLSRKHHLSTAKVIKFRNELVK